MTPAAPAPSDREAVDVWNGLSPAQRAALLMAGSFPKSVSFLGYLVTVRALERRGLLEQAGTLRSRSYQRTPSGHAVAAAGLAAADRDGRAP